MKIIPATSPTTPPHKAEGWKGYTLNQLRYRRAYVTARLELEKEQLGRDIKAERQALTPLSIVSHVGSALRYANWGVLAFQAIKLFMPLLKKKK